MEIKEMLNEISQKYKLNKKNSTTIQIEVPNMINAFHGMYVVLKCENNKLILSDNGTILDTLEFEEDQIKPILQKYNVNFDNYYLEKQYTCLQDIQTFIDCLEEISNI